MTKPTGSLPSDPYPLRLAALGFLAHASSGVAYLTPPMCAVPAGPFLMGSDKARTPHASHNEPPQYLIETSAFQIGTYPVTVAEYACAVCANAVREPPTGIWRPIAWQDQLTRLDHPVVCVSWHDAVAYARWLAEVAGQPWRLPTEAEWEKAARGADGRSYPWGNRFARARCNTDASKLGATTPVGAYPGGASPCGAQDMAGNVWEWTSSLLHLYPYSTQDGREQPNAPGIRVLRGGSWRNAPRHARVSYRNVGFPADLNGYFGFRLALRADPGSG